jgi:hypothetical protein
MYLRKKIEGKLRRGYWKKYDIEGWMTRVKMDDYSAAEGKRKKMLTTQCG